MKLGNHMTADEMKLMNEYQRQLRFIRDLIANAKCEGRTFPLSVVSRMDEEILTLSKKSRSLKNVALARKLLAEIKEERK